MLRTNDIQKYFYFALNYTTTVSGGVDAITAD